MVQGEPMTWLWKRAGDVRRTLRSKHMKSSGPETDEKDKRGEAGKTWRRRYKWAVHRARTDGERGSRAGALVPTKAGRQGLSMSTLRAFDLIAGMMHMTGLGK